MRKTVFSYRKRAFLNPASTGKTSYINLQVESSQGGKYRFGDNLIHLADCHRAVQLEFFLGTKRDREMSLDKINSLIDHFTTFRETLKKEIDLIEKAE